MIRFGPAGIPLSCKGRTLRDGIADVHHLGLGAMEIQYIKVNPLQRVAMDEEIGHRPRELLLQLAVAVGPAALPQAIPTLSSLTSPIRRRDTITTITTSLSKDYADLQQTRALARSLDVALSLHAPYYVDFFGSAESRERSKRQIQWAGVLAEGLGAGLVVTHLGFYGNRPRPEATSEITGILRELSDWLRRYTHQGARLGIEPSGHPDVFGSREEVLDLVRRVKGVVPVLNLPHLVAREHRLFEKPEDLEPVVREFLAASGGRLYLNFSGVEYYGPGEMRLTPVKRGLVRFDPLAELLAERDYDVTVISSSPLLEHDAMYMKLLYERALTRRWQKKHSPPPSLPRSTAVTLLPARGGGAGRVAPARGGSMHPSPARAGAPKRSPAPKARPEHRPKPRLHPRPHPRRPRKHPGRERRRSSKRRRGGRRRGSRR